MIAATRRPSRSTAVQARPEPGAGQLDRVAAPRRRTSRGREASRRSTACGRRGSRRASRAPARPRRCGGASSARGQAAQQRRSAAEHGDRQDRGRHGASSEQQEPAAGVERPAGRRRRSRPRPAMPSTPSTSSPRSARSARARRRAGRVTRQLERQRGEHRHSSRSDSGVQRPPPRAARTRAGGGGSGGTWASSRRLACAAVELARAGGRAPSGGERPAAGRPTGGQRRAEAPARARPRRRARRAGRSPRGRRAPGRALTRWARRRRRERPRAGRAVRRSPAAPPRSTSPVAAERLDLERRVVGGLQAAHAARARVGVGVDAVAPGRHDGADVPACRAQLEALRRARRSPARTSPVLGPRLQREAAEGADARCRRAVVSTRAEPRKPREAHVARPRCGWSPARCRGPSSR